MPKHMPIKNPPAWVADEATWERAKKAVRPESKKSQRRYSEPYAVVAHVYRNMGGKIRRRRKTKR